MAKRGYAVHALHWRRRSATPSLLQLRELPPGEVSARGSEERLLWQARGALHALSGAAADNEREFKYNELRDKKDAIERELEAAKARARASSATAAAR